MWVKLYKSNPYKTIKARMNISLPAIEQGGACMIYFKITKHLEQWGASLSLMGICDSSSWQNKSSAVCQTTQRTWRNAAHGAWCSLQAPKPQADETQNCQKRTLPQMLPQYLHRWPEHVRNSNLKHPKKHSHYKQCLLNHFLKQRDHRIQTWLGVVAQFGHVGRVPHVDI